MRKILILVLLILCGSKVSRAACSGSSPTLTAASAAQADIQACITIAHNGDTILVPASAGVSYSTPVSIPSTVCVTINGQNGVTITSQIGFVINESATCESRVTGFTFSGGSSGPPSSSTNIIVNGGAFASRVDHNTFNATGVQIYIIVNSIDQSTGQSYPTVIDHNTFSCGYTAQAACEAIHNQGAVNASLQVGWVNNVSPGGPNMVFIEDNTFNQTGANNFNQISAVEQFYGSQTVIRHNTLNFCAQLDAHGTATFTGARWWEIYNNQFNNNNFSCPTNMQLRGGTGVVFNNVSDGTSTNSTPCSPACFIDIFNENGSTSTWPNEWQVGSGINGNTNGHVSCPGPLNNAPAQLWNNTNLPVGGAGPVPTVLINRDYFVSASQPATINWEEAASDTCSTVYNYAPYIYPHPLVSGSSSITISGASDFGNISQGTLSGWESLTLTNTGTASAGLTSYTITGTNSSDFLVFAGYNNTAVWTPSTTWTSGQFIVDSNGNMETVTTTGAGGTGTHPTWGTVIGQVTVDNAAKWNMIGAYPNGCGTTLAAGASCVIVLAFQPTAVAGTHEVATLNVNFTGGVSPATGAVSGTSSSAFVSPNLPVAPTQVNLPLLITHTAVNPYGTVLNQSLLVPSTTYTVCPSGCSFTDVNLQAALTQAFADCQTNTSLVLLFNTETIHTSSGFTVGNGINGCAPGKYLRFETNHPELLPPDGVRINHSFAGVMPQLVEDNANGYTIQLAHSMSNFEMRGIGFSNNSSFVSQGNFTFRCSDEVVTATAAIPKNIILDQLVFWAGGVTGNLSRNAILADCNNLAVINNDVENYQYTATDNQAIVSWCSDGPQLISNNTFSATTENFDIGGNGCAITDGGLSGNPFPVVSNVTVASNYIFKPLRWRSYNCGSTTGTFCGPGFSWIDLSPPPTTSACTSSQCQVNITFLENSVFIDMHPFDNTVLANCANTLFNGTYGILQNPLPTNVGGVFTFSVVNTSLNSTNAPNGTTTTGCTISSFYDPQYLPPADGAFQYDVKNLIEQKEGLNILYIGNWVATSWQGSQSEMLIFQETNPVLGTTNYAPWDATGNIRITTNTWDNADINGYGLDMWTALNAQLTNIAAAGSSLGTIAPIEFDNNLVYHLGPQFGYYEEWGSHGNPTAPTGNGQLPDLFFNHNTVLQNSVNPALGTFDLFQFASPNNLQVGQTPFLRNAINNSILDFGQIRNGAVAYPYVNQKCEINSGLAVPCFTPAAWVANIPLATVTGTSIPFGCTNTNNTASFQPNAGPAGVGSSFCPTANLGAVGLANTTINTGSSPISPGMQTVTPVSMTNISVGVVLFIGSSTNGEYVPVVATAGGTFTAPFVNAHTSQITTVIGTTPPSSSIAHGAGVDGLDIGANAAAVVTMTSWVPSGVPPGSVVAPPTKMFVKQISDLLLGRLNGAE